MIIQLNPSIPLEVVDTPNFPKGSGEAIALIDYSKEDDLLWVIIMDSSGEIWTVPNQFVRGIGNVSIGRNT